MIINGIEVSSQEKARISKIISSISEKPNASLLRRGPEEIIDIINSGITLVKIAYHKREVLFITAFNETSEGDYVEVSMVCNLKPNEIRGKNIFPAIINYYQERNGNCDIRGNFLNNKKMFLTTTNSRMTMVAPKAGFCMVNNPNETFPLNVRKFCCSPCPTSKTGSSQPELQPCKCPRFTGEFIPPTGEIIMQRKCEIFERSF